MAISLSLNYQNFQKSIIPLSSTRLSVVVTSFLANYQHYKGLEPL
jgi:hypothetical protein